MNQVSSSTECNNLWIHQELHILWEPKHHCSIRKSPPVDLVLRNLFFFLCEAFWYFPRPTFSFFFILGCLIKGCNESLLVAWVLQVTVPCLYTTRDVSFRYFLVTTRAHLTKDCTVNCGKQVAFSQLNSRLRDT
jgi:hypothetical protein